MLCHVRKFSGPFFFLPSNSDNDDLPGHATVVSFTHLEDHQSYMVQDGAIPFWARVVRELLDMIGRHEPIP